MRRNDRERIVIVIVIIQRLPSPFPLPLPLPLLLLSFLLPPSPSLGGNRKKRTRRARGVSRASVGRSPTILPDEKYGVGEVIRREFPTGSVSYTGDERTTLKGSASRNRSHPARMKPSLSPTFEPIPRKRRDITASCEALLRRYRTTSRTHGPSRRRQPHNLYSV